MSAVSYVKSCYDELVHKVSWPTMSELQNSIDKLRNEVNDILADQNDINESTRAQLDAISKALAELQAGKHLQKPRKRIGFIQEEENK